MNSRIFAYLKRNNLVDTDVVNRLFVSAFVSLRGLRVVNNHLISNLLIKENDEQYLILQEFIAVLQQYHSAEMNIEDLVNLFEFVISPSDRIVTGAIYTPYTIRHKIIEICLQTFSTEKMKDIRVADIACGCGGFLMDIAYLLHTLTNRSYYQLFNESIYGIDIQDYSVERTQILLSLLALQDGEDTDFNFNILHADTLDYHTINWNRNYDNFDIILGNPPYVCSRNVDIHTKQKMLTYEVCQSGHPDLYLPFFQIATEMLNDGGRLGLITMNSFIRSVNGRAVRKYFSQGKHEISILDFRGYQVFKKRSTYTCLFFLTKNRGSNSLKYAVNETGDLSNNLIFSTISYTHLDNKKGWSLNDFETVRQMESSGISIGDYCHSRHGIATLSNKTYIFKPINEDEIFYYLKLDHTVFPIEKSICRDVVNSNKLNSIVEFDSILEKLIFPYIIANGKAQLINELTMKTKYPQAYKYLSFNRDKLSKRDKGKTDKYPAWYAYGRTQSLIMPRYKLFFPKFANKPLHCIIIDDSNLMLYNGVAFVSDNIEKLELLKEVLDSEEFWNYITKNAKPYASGYYSLSGVDIKNYGIPLGVN